MNTLAIALYPNAWDTFMFMIIGFVIVMGVLAFQSIITALLGKFFSVLESKTANKTAETKKKSVAPSVQNPQGNAELAGVIGSAVYAALDGAPHRIVSVTPSNGPAPEIVAAITAAAMIATGGCSVVSIKPAAPDFNWASSGRMAIFNSHRPNK